MVRKDYRSDGKQGVVGCRKSGVIGAGVQGLASGYGTGHLEKVWTTPGLGGLYSAGFSDIRIIS